MAFQSRLIRCLFLGALLALLVVAVGLPGAAGARPAPKPYPTQAPVGPKCLGRPATVVGQGTIHGTAHADVIVAIEGRSPYPERAAFIDADTPQAGREIQRAADEGRAIVLVADGSSRVLRPISPLPQRTMQACGDTGLRQPEPVLIGVHPGQRPQGQAQTTAQDHDHCHHSYTVRHRVSASDVRQTCAGYGARGCFLTF
jgi:hypothetical protein